MKKELENERVIFRISEGPVVEYIFKENAHADLKSVEIDYDFYISFLNKELGEDATFLSLVELSKNIKIDNDAMKRLSELYTPLEVRKRKQAFVCTSHVARILVYIFIKLGGNSTPLKKKTFTSKQKALEWLMLN